ncbi:MAG: spermidine/putrescine ABC transporter permease PotC [Desulfotignum sp.]|nr:spermidine/putrescine ABC transporter permease PotC [Desulfotignum sp.]MCF8126545.1 spermidine/putrescine ABC transporter permease PotC [Desulfotignum sp.]
MRKWVGISWIWAVFAFLYGPLLVLMVFSFNQARYTTSWQGFSFKWYISLLENQQLLDAFVNSLTVALVSSLAATAMGTLGAFAVSWYRFAGRKLFFSLVYSVMMSPDIVMGISLLMLFVLAGVTPGFFTLLTAHITFCLPFVIVLIHARIAGFDPAVVDAARDLGAKEHEVFFKIVFPMILPAVLAGWLLSFTLSLDDVIISFFVTGPGFEILPLKIYSMVKLGVTPEVNALCTVLFLLTLAAVMTAHFLIKEKKR